MSHLGATKPLVWFICMVNAGIGVKALAADWSTSREISIGQSYTDNVGLDSVGEDSASSLVLTPSFTVKGEGARVSVDVSAAFQITDAGGDADNFNPNVQADSELELVEDFLFLDFGASARQASIDPFAASGRSGLNDNRNSTTIYQYNATPYIRSRIKDFVSYELRYNRDDQRNEGGELDDSTEDSASFDLVSGRYFGRFSWGVSSSYRSTDYDDSVGNVSTTAGSDNEFISSTLRFGYRFSRKWQINTSVGKEWNDYVSVEDDVDGDSWNAGMIWTPNQRIAISLGYGERYFGSTPSFDISYRHKRSELQLGYSRSVRDSRGLRQQGSISGFRSGLGQFTSLTSNSNSTIIDERLEFAFKVEGRRTQLSLGGNRSLQTREDTGVEDRFSDYTLMIGRKLAGNLSLDFSYSWDKREEGGSDNEIVTDYYTLGFNHKLGANTSLTLSYNFTDRDSDEVGDDYKENRVSLILNTNY